MITPTLIPVMMQFPFKPLMKWIDQKFIQCKLWLMGMQTMQINSLPMCITFIVVNTSLSVSYNYLLSTTLTHIASYLHIAFRCKPRVVYWAH